MNNLWRERLQAATEPPPLQVVASEPPLQDLRMRLHRQLLAQVDLREMERLSPAQVRQQLQRIGEQLMTTQGVSLNEAERREVLQGVQNEMLGLGPLEPLLADPTVSDILVNGPCSVYVERRGRLESTGVRFADDAHLLRVIDRIVSRVGRRIDEMSPMVDARLPDGSRVNAVIAPLAMDGPLLAIRRFAVRPWQLQDLVAAQMLCPAMAEWLTAVVRARLNVLISGGTGSGKTTLLNVLSGAIGAHERIVTIEDAAELQLQQPHVVRLETRPPNLEGQGEVTQRALVRNSLRMRPDRIVLGEVRGAEVLDMLQAMNTGHDGSMSTVHANSPRDAITRLEHMIGMAGLQLDVRTMRQQIGAALSVVVQVARLSDGQRKVVSVQEITGLEGEVITLQEIFAFRQQGVSPGGQVQGRFEATGIRPRCTGLLQARGQTLREDLFRPVGPGAA
jgi:pilus assembly protein CpaF